MKNTRLLTPDLSKTCAAICLLLGMAITTDRPVDAAPLAPTTVSEHDTKEALLPQAVFQTLLGEIALRRGETLLAVDAWFDLAMKSRDLKALERATELTFAIGDYQRAVQLVEIWLSVAPDSEKASHFELLLLQATGQIDALLPRLTAFLAEEKNEVPNHLLQLYSGLSRSQDKVKVKEVIDKLTAPYLSLPEAHLARSEAALGINDKENAIKSVDAALKIRPTWDRAVLLRAQILSLDSPENALSWLRAFLDKNPKENNLRLHYAQKLIAARSYEAARAQFKTLLSTDQDNEAFIYPLAVLAMQQKDYPEAKAYFDRLLTLDNIDQNKIHALYGELAQEEKDVPTALWHLGQVTHDGQNAAAYFGARLQMAKILLSAGKPIEASAVLDRSTATNPKERQIILLSKYQLWRDANNLPKAYAALIDALKNAPDEADLRYEAAMLAEQMGKPDVSESHLRHVLKKNPDHAQALNALGYSLANQNTRLVEARKLIEKAIKITPDSPDILDSLGWVQYRQGEKEAALANLKKAYEKKQESEIAAHIVEVLWSLKRQEEAREIYRKALEKDPDNAFLKNLKKKFNL